MSYAAINTEAMTVIVVTASIEQSHAHADIKCKRDNFIIVDTEHYEWKQFTQADRRLLMSAIGPNGRVPSCAEEISAKEINRFLDRIEDDDTSLEELNGKRQSVPVIHAEGVKTANTNTHPRGVKSPTPNHSALRMQLPTIEKPSNKKVVYGLMDAKWDSVGNKTDNIPALRIELMNEMADSHPDIKRTTISTTLGGWVKENIK